MKSAFHEYPYWENKPANMQVVERMMDEYAREVLTDKQWEMEYQGLFFLDKGRYLNGKGFGFPERELVRIYKIYTT